MIYIQSFLIWLYTKSPLICYNKSKANGLEHCESSILYREGFILCYPSKKTASIAGCLPFFLLPRRADLIHVCPISALYKDGTLGI